MERNKETGTFSGMTREEIEKILEEYDRSNSKENWPDGEWKAEPDKEDFEYKGYKCHIKRSDVSGGLCGYVAVSKGSIFYDVDYDDIDLNVHGGVTFGGVDEVDGLYWIGFDCAHWLDYSPKSTTVMELTNRLLQIEEKYPHFLQERDEKSTYKNIEFVRNQCRSMVDQLIEKESHGTTTSQQ